MIAKAVTFERESAQDERVPLLTVQEAADYLRVSASLMNQWRVNGGGPRFAKLGKRIVYRRIDLESFVASRLKRTTSDL